MTDWAAHRVGAAHERKLALIGERKKGGAYYTPPDVIERLLDLCLDPILAERHNVDDLRALRVLDPACGSGNFLEAVGARIKRALENCGVARSQAAGIAFGECLVGIDRDPTAVDLCVSSLSAASGGTVSEGLLRDRIHCADALASADGEQGLVGGIDWPRLLTDAGAPDGFDLVVGNPPFLNQLASETARSEVDAARLRRRFGSAVAGLTDTAVLFLVLSVDIAKEEQGVTCLIQPLSVLSTRDAAGAREALQRRCGIRAAWICEEEEVFDASVRVCAPVFVRGETFELIELFSSRSFIPAGAARSESLTGATWSALLATAQGVLDRELHTDGVVADVAAATADFRDQYYGLRGCVIDAREADDAALPPLVTVGLIDPAALLWGTRSTRFDKVTYDCPRVDVARLEPRLQAWARVRLGPKLMLATQTKVLEAYVDAHGRCLPSVPVITVTTDDVEDLWLLGALLGSPPITLVAARRHLGAALSSDALKLSASDVLQLPLPADRSSWQQAARHYERACRSPGHAQRLEELERSAELMCHAFGLPGDAELMAWWASRMPARGK